MPRRATIRRSGGRASIVGLLALAAVLGALVGGLVWLGSALSPSFPPVLDARAAASAAVAGAHSQPEAAAPPTEQEAALLGVGQLAAADSAIELAATPGAAPSATLRQWQASAPGMVADVALARQLDRVLAGVDGHVGVAVKDLGSDRGAVLNGDLELQSASLYKLPILYSVFAASLGMGEALPITDEALSFDAGTMELGPGETLSVAEALERMLTLSDNASAIMLASRVGAYRINSSIAALGMDTTHYSLERMTTSAIDMLRLVERVADGDAVSRVASADMLHLMLRQRVNDRLPRLLPVGVQVAHKTGNLPGIVNDVGVLYGPHTTIAVAVLISDTADESAAATAIAEIARTAYLYFDAQKPIADRPLIPPAPARPIPPVWREPHPPTPTPTAEPTDVAPVELEPRPTATPAVAILKPTPLAGPPAAVPQPPLAPPAAQPPAPAAATPTSVPSAPTATSAPPPPTPTLLPTAAAVVATRAPTRPAPAPAPATAVPPNKR